MTSFEDFEAVVKPVNEFLRKNYHPHTIIVVDYDGAHIYEASMGIPQLNREKE
jgi:hypothetical protein